MAAYYNEIDPYAAQWLRNLISAGHIAPGDVDERSIVDVQPDDLEGYAQCHFFAGLGGWSYAARLAGWPDDRAIWTGSCPCQPFSVAGKGDGQADERHLWPVFAKLIGARRPAVIMGEQVAAAVGKHWLDGVFADLEDDEYACRAVIVPACAVDAPHRRDRLWFVADAQCESEGRWRLHGPNESRSEAASGPPAQSVGTGLDGSVAYAAGGGLATDWRSQETGRVYRSGHPDIGGAGTWGPMADADLIGEGEGREQRSGQLGRSRSNSRGSAWIGAEWLRGVDGKARRIEPGIRLLAHGVPARVGKLRAYGNAIVPQVAAEVIAAFLDAERELAA